MKKPSISVIMSTYNALPYLKDAVESILNQTYKNFEFIIINDASTDNTLKYLKSLKDKRLKIFTNKTNLGLAATLNKAFKASKGQYIARMDADDISELKRFETQLNFMKNHNNIDICGSWAKLIDEKGNKIGNVHKPTSDIDIKKLNKWMTGIIHPTWFIKREVFEKLGGYSKKWDYVEDMDFLIRAKNFKMANIPLELLLWRSPQNRRSNKNINKIYNKSFMLRLHFFLKGEFNILYLPLLFRSAISNYLFPTKFKIFLNKKAGLV